MGRINKGLLLVQPARLSRSWMTTMPFEEALFDLLQVEGLSARTFENGPALLADEAIMAFDCVITDVRMPGIDGLELQRRLRARDVTVPMIFITSSVQETTRRHAMTGGAAAWFTKPVTDELLLNALRTALKERGTIPGAGLTWRALRRHRYRRCRRWADRTIRGCRTIGRPGGHSTYPTRERRSHPSLPGPYRPTGSKRSSAGSGLPMSTRTPRIWSDPMPPGGA